MMGEMARRWMWTIGLAAGCAGRSNADEGATTSSSASDDASPNEGGHEDGNEGDEDAVVPCDAPQVSDVIVSVWPGQDPVAATSDFVIAELECVIEGRDDGSSGVELELACTDENGPLADMVRISVDAEGIEVPAELTIGAAVQARVYTWRDAEYFAEYPWRSADHFALLLEGELVLGGGSGATLPTRESGDWDASFFAPVIPYFTAGQCPGEPFACHEPWRSAWDVRVDDETVVSPAFSLLRLGGYEMHLGDLATSDDPACGEPYYTHVGLAIARL